MKPPFLDAAIVKAMQADPSANAEAVRAEVGCTKSEFNDAVKRLRWAGKMPFGRAFTLSASLLSPSTAPAPAADDANGGAGIARREDPRLHAADPTLPSAPNPLWVDIHCFLVESGMTQTEFLRRASINSAQLGKIRNGQDLSSDVMERVRAVVASGGKFAHELGFDNRRSAQRASPIKAEVEAEVAALGERRGLARKISATVHDPLPTHHESPADRIRRLARELDDEEAEALLQAEGDERRLRDLERLPNPSSVLRRAQRDWPQQCADVQALAAELGVSLGEAWRRVIKAGVDCMRESGEGAAA